MTIKKRLARSNIAMFVIPVLVAAVLLLIGLGIGFALLERVYLPQLGISLGELHQTGEEIERLLSDSAAILRVYAGAVVMALLLTIAWTNYYLTRNLFRHISEPLEALTAGVARVRDGDLDTPIAYREADEFKAARDAVDEMAARLKASLEERQSEQQRKQELIAGMSHDLKSPLTSIRAYTEALLEGVAQDEAAKERYLRTIRAKEADMEAMVNRLFEFAKMDVSEYPVQREALHLHAAALRRFLYPQDDLHILLLRAVILPHSHPVGSAAHEYLLAAKIIRSLLKACLPSPQVLCRIRRSPFYRLSNSHSGRVFAIHPPFFPCRCRRRWQRAPESFR